MLMVPMTMMISQRPSSNAICNCCSLMLIECRPSFHHHLTMIEFRIFSKYKTLIVFLHVNEVSTRFDFFLSRFALLTELARNPVELYSESNSASNGTTFKVGHRSKSAICTENTFSRDPIQGYSSSVFALLPKLNRNPVDLYSESNSAFNGTTFKVGHRSKNATYTRDTSSRDPLLGYSSSGFAILSELNRNSVDLYSESNSASNGTTFKVGHRTKSATYTRDTSSRDPLPGYSSLGFALLPELAVTPVELYAERICVSIVPLEGEERGKQE